MESKAVEAHLKTGGEALEYANRAGATRIAAQVPETFQQLKIRRKLRFMVLVIGGEEITVESTAPPDATYDDMLERLPFTDCRYVVFDKEYTTHDGRKANKLFFVAWLPHNATPYNKMAYTHAKRMMRESLDGVFDVTVSTRDELEVAMGYKQEEAVDSESDIEDF